MDINERIALLLKGERYMLVGLGLMLTELNYTPELITIYETLWEVNTTMHLIYGLEPTTPADVIRESDEINQLEKLMKQS